MSERFSSAAKIAAQLLRGEAPSLLTHLRRSKRTLSPSDIERFRAADAPRFGQFMDLPNAEAGLTYIEPEAVERALRNRRNALTMMSRQTFHDLAAPLPYQNDPLLGPPNLRIRDDKLGNIAVPVLRDVPRENFHYLEMLRNKDIPMVEGHEGRHSFLAIDEPYLPVAIYPRSAEKENVKRSVAPSGIYQPWEMEQAFRDRFIDRMSTDQWGQQDTGILRARNFPLHAAGGKVRSPLTEINRRQNHAP